MFSLAISSVYSMEPVFKSEEGTLTNLSKVCMILNEMPEKILKSPSMFKKKIDERLNENIAETLGKDLNFEGIPFEQLPQEIKQAYANNLHEIENHIEKLKEARGFLKKIRNIKRGKNSSKIIDLASSASIIECGELVQEEIEKFQEILKPSII